MRMRQKLIELQEKKISTIIVVDVKPLYQNKQIRQAENE